MSVLDVCKRPGCEIVALPLRKDDDGFVHMDMDVLQETYTRLKQEGRRVAAVLYTNPHNPTGIEKAAAKTE